MTKRIRKKILYRTPEEQERLRILTMSLLENDPNFIAIKRYNYSIDSLLERYPDGAPDHVIANALMIDKNEVQDIYVNIVSKIKAAIELENQE